MDHDAVWLEGLHSDAHKESELLNCVGITEYSSPDIPGFEATFKDDWKNFKVVEIGKNGEEVDQESHPYEPFSTSSPPYVECTLRKRHLSMPHAISLLCKTFKIPPQAISYRGTKDFVADTYQRIRVKGINPDEVIFASDTILGPRGLDLFNLAPATKPFVLGQLQGNRFEVRLTNVVASHEDVIHRAVKNWEMRGFLNYFGSQRFSWFGGARGISYYMLKHDSISAVYSLLNYTNTKRSWLDLLERPKMYPLPVQEHMRRRMILEFTRNNVMPQDLKTLDRKGCLSPDLEGVNDVDLDTEVNTDPRHGYRKLMFHVTMRALQSVPRTSMRLMAQQFPNYLWNQALSHRVAVLGAKKVLPGDILSPHSGEGVLHPSFTFHNNPLPNNRVRSIYHALCKVYKLDWSSNVFHDSWNVESRARAIICKPRHVSYKYNPTDRELFLNFTLPKGTYASVALRDLMKAQRVPGMDDTSFTPMSDVLWDIGRLDPAHIPTIREMYPGFIQGEGFEEELFDELGNPLHKSKSLEEIRTWSTGNLIRNGKRHVLNNLAKEEALFEPRPINLLPHSESELNTYVLDHAIPLRAHQNSKLIRKQLLKRRKSLIRTPLAELDPEKKIIKQIEVGRNKRGKGRTRMFEEVTGDKWNRHYGEATRRARLDAGPYHKV